MKKKLGLGIVLGLIALLSAMVVIMVMIPVNYKPEISSPNRIAVLNSENREHLCTETENSEIYDETIKLFEQSFSRSFLSALFAGQLGGTTEKIPETNTLQDFTGYKVTFKYNEPQTLIVNGKSSGHKFNKMILEVKEINAYRQLTVYFQQTTNSKFYYYITTYANQSELFEYLNTLDYLIA